MRSAGQEEGFNPHFHPQKWRWSMKVSQAVDLFIDYHKKNSPKNTIRGQLERLTGVSPANETPKINFFCNGLNL